MSRFNPGQFTAQFRKREIAEDYYRNNGTHECLATRFVDLGIVTAIEVLIDYTIKSGEIQSINVVDVHSVVFAHGQKVYPFEDIREPTKSHSIEQLEQIWLKHFDQSFTTPDDRREWLFEQALNDKRH